VGLAQSPPIARLGCSHGSLILGKWLPTTHSAGLYLRHMPLTQWRALVGVGKPAKQSVCRLAFR